MDLSTQLQNNEQRYKFSTVGQVLGTMPGGQTLTIGEQHIIGAVPFNSITTGWIFTAARLPGDIVVSVGFTGNPTFWLDNVTVSDGVPITQDRANPMQDYFPNGEDIILTVESGSLLPDSLLRFVLFGTELEVKIGTYTA
jgi:hypothetical protein